MGVFSRTVQPADLSARTIFLFNDRRHLDIVPNGFNDTTFTEIDRASIFIQQHFCNDGTSQNHFTPGLIL